MAATISSDPLALSAAINPAQRLAWLIFRSSRLDVGACMLRLAALLTSRAQIEACQPDRPEWYGRG